MADETEDFRRAEVARINSEAAEREALETRYGAVWDTSQLQEDFSVEGFCAPYVVVRRKADGVKGSLEFQHHPRFYFNFQAT